MDIIPFQHESYGSRRKAPLDYSVLDIHHDLVIPIDRVKMGWSMVTIIQGDNDAEESTDLWQRRFLSSVPSGMVGSGLTTQLSRRAG
jgi:hypothetical protein